MTVAEPEPEGDSLAVTLAGQVIAQVEELLTRTVKLQEASTLFEPSVPLQLTTDSPTGKLEPDGGLHVIVRVGQSPTVVGVE